MTPELHIFIEPDLEDGVTDWYEGVCPMTKVQARLPRTIHAEWLSRQLMAEFADDPSHNIKGKMYGVLIVESERGDRFYLKAFSGFFHGQKHVPGWVPVIDGGDRLVLEEQEILAELQDIRVRFAELEKMPERPKYATLAAAWQTKIDRFNAQYRENKKARQQQREEYQRTLHGEELRQAIHHLNDLSFDESTEKRHLKRQRDQEIGELKKIVEAADKEVEQLRIRRRKLSRTLQKQMHRVYKLKNFAGDAQAIADLVPQTQGLPTGTGDCCAPKLLNYAAKHHLQPLALAEFWWGKNLNEKISGEFYLACEERCQPIMGFLLSGLEEKSFATILKTKELPFEIAYEDDTILVINKPSGLATIPGRSSHYYDSLLSRLKRDRPEMHLVHRLDHDTSGLIIFAKTQAAQNHLQKQFIQRQISKTYIAILENPIQNSEGIIELPLWSDPRDRPYQKVDFDQGKPSKTEFIRLDQYRIQLKPVTGRTHQLRVHCADPRGLNNPIRGDQLYSKQPEMAKRLCLHAAKITFQHPATQNEMTLHIDAPF